MSPPALMTPHATPCRKRVPRRSARLVQLGIVAIVIASTTRADVIQHAWFARLNRKLLAIEPTRNPKPRLMKIFVNTAKLELVRLCRSGSAVPMRPSDKPWKEFVHLSNRCCWLMIKYQSILTSNNNLIEVALYKHFIGIAPLSSNLEVALYKFPR